MGKIYGKFITFEGIEGAGKSTQIRLTQQTLSTAGIDVVITREPGGSELGEKIRALLLHEEMHELTELLLMFAARNEHIKKTILPALDAGKWVLCDRFVESSYAYQGFGRGMPLDIIESLEAMVVGDLRPDVTFWFDLPVRIGLERTKKRDCLDRFEKEKEDFFEKVAKGFRYLSEHRSSQFIRVDATVSEKELQKIIAGYLL